MPNASKLYAIEEGCEQPFSSKSLHLLHSLQLPVDMYVPHFSASTRMYLSARDLSIVLAALILKYLFFIPEKGAIGIRIYIIYSFDQCRAISEYLGELGGQDHFLLKFLHPVLHNSQNKP